MNDLSAVISLMFIVASGIWYYPLVIRRYANPTPATLILGACGINIAVVSYGAIPGRTFVENVTLYAAALHVNFFLLLVMFVLWRSSQLRVTFDWLQKTFLTLMAAILVYWIFNQDQPQTTFWTVQLLIAVSYVATISKAVQLKTAFDSIGNMGLIFACSIIGVLPALMMASPYGTVNSVRAIITSGITLSVLVYFDRKNTNTRWRDELTTIKGFYKIVRA